MSVSKAIVLMGIICMVVGLGLTTYQLVTVKPDPGNPRELNVSKEGLSIKTAYPGIIVLAVGAVLLLGAGYLGRKRN